MMSRNKLKNIIKQLISEKIIFDAREPFLKSSDKPLNFNFASDDARLKTDPLWNFRNQVQKNIELGNAKTYSDDWKGNLQAWGDDIKDTDWFKTLDKIGTIYKDKKFDVSLPKNYGKLTFGKIRTDDPLSPNERTELTARKTMGDFKGEIPKKVDTMGIKWSVDVDKINPFKKKT